MLLRDISWQPKAKRCPVSEVSQGRGALQHMRGMLWCPSSSEHSLETVDLSHEGCPSSQSNLSSQPGLLPTASKPAVGSLDVSIGTLDLSKIKHFLRMKSQRRFERFEDLTSLPPNRSEKTSTTSACDMGVRRHRLGQLGS